MSLVLNSWKNYVNQNHWITWNKPVDSNQFDCDSNHSKKNHDFDFNRKAQSSTIKKYTLLFCNVNALLLLFFTLQNLCYIDELFALFNLILGIPSDRYGTYLYSLWYIMYWILKNIFQDISSHYLHISGFHINITTK